MASVKGPLRRCAIYTRKSTEEGLEQDFNSLHAQREACAAYIRSQVGEGWKVLPDPYDDGGFSGGTMDRPALIRLLDDIASRKIDTVVVYKVDRLTRSLADFARIVDIFDGHEVSFVSVTQQFNTTTSMGRLTLNMLLSFAQFEREVTGERIRDKIAASKQKGMWMGGVVPLGYEPDGRTLTINKTEAKTVRMVFDLYLKNCNVRMVKEEADRLKLITKVRKDRNGGTRGGRPMSRGYIYKLLGNPLYAGRIAHKDKVYDGRHPAIIDKETWKAVQAMLAGNTPNRSTTNRSSSPSPLRGILHDEDGIPLTPSHAVKSGRRYRYYVSRKFTNGAAEEGTNQNGWRLPAREIERTVEDSVHNLLGDPATMAQAARENGVPANRISHIITAVGQWAGHHMDLVERVDLEIERITIGLNLSSLTGQDEITLQHVVPTRIKRRGVEIRLVLEASGSTPAEQDPALIKAVARAHKWLDDLMNERMASLREIAKAEGVTPRYVGNLFPLAFLAPDIVEAILNGTQPPDLTLERIIRHIDLPQDWSEQRVVLGFD